MKLQAVISNTVTHNSCVSSKDNLVGYISGNYAVVLNAQTKSKTFFKASNALSCLSLGHGLVAAGEKNCKNPKILVWNLESEELIHEISGHQFGVAAISFSSSSFPCLCSVGVSNDGYLFVHDLSSQQATVICANKISQNVNSVSFRDNSTFVTAGNRFFKKGKICKITFSFL